MSTPNQTIGTPAIPWKKYSAIVSAAYGIYKLFFDRSLPDAAFGFFLAALALALEYSPERVSRGFARTIEIWRSICAAPGRADRDRRHCLCNQNELRSPVDTRSIRFHI